MTASWLLALAWEAFTRAATRSRRDEHFASGKVCGRRELVLRRLGPGLDDDGHHWAGREEVDKVLRGKGGWLGCATVAGGRRTMRAFIRGQERRGQEPTWWAVTSCLECEAPSSEVHWRQLSRPLTPSWRAFATWAATASARVPKGDDVDEHGRLVLAVAALEAGFIPEAAPYCRRKGITYEAWRAAGVEPRVLRWAGIGRAR
jgi:hypothetical protein